MKYQISMRTFTLTLAIIISTLGMLAQDTSSKYLGEGNDHNSFIITEEGDYWFSVSHLSNINNAFVLWNENGESDIINVKLDGSRLSFTKNGNKKGNASISVTDEDNVILWTWWIWTTDQPEYYEKDGTWMMDRNLGATTIQIGSPDSYGLFFNPGNPFPFPGPKYKDFIITETPSVPKGWYVAEGYGFYTDSKKPTPQTPMMLCTDKNKYGNSVYFSQGLNPCPNDAFTPWTSTFLRFIGDEPKVSAEALIGDEGYNIPCIYYDSLEEGYGRYLCQGIYNHVAVDTYTVYFYDGMAKYHYCEGASLLPIRAFSMAPLQDIIYPGYIQVIGNGLVYVNGIEKNNSSFSIKSEEKQEIYLVPSEGYKIGCVEINGVNKTYELKDNMLTLDHVTEEVIIKVIFSPITIKLGFVYEQGGSVSIESNYGQSQTILFNVEEDWEIYGVYLNWSDITDDVIEDLHYTTPPLYEDTSIKIIYRKTNNSSVNSIKSIDDVSLRLMDQGKCVITLQENSNVSVYSLDGRLIENTSLTKGENTLQLLENRVYIIHIGTRTFKVCL